MPDGKPPSAVEQELAAAVGGTVLANVADAAAAHTRSALRCRSRACGGAPQVLAMIAEVGCLVKAMQLSILIYWIG